MITYFYSGIVLLHNDTVAYDIGYIEDIKMIHEVFVNFRERLFAPQILRTVFCVTFPPALTWDNNYFFSLETNKQPCFRHPPGNMTLAGDLRFISLGYHGERHDHKIINDILKTS